MSLCDIENHPNSLYIQACYLDVELSMPTIVMDIHLKQVMKGHFINQDENPLSLALGLVSGELLLHKQLNNYLWSLAIGTPFLKLLSY